MFETIEKLLILQDRDKQIHRVKSELEHIEPERTVLKTGQTEPRRRLMRQSSR